ncbi:NfeD family protein [Mariniblastus sp.]|nr:NfeD family protein [Mariniblastus sp.]
MFYTALILLLVGLCLLALELFVPSAGVLGIVAGCVILASVVMAFMTDSFSGMIFLMVALLVIPMMLFMMIKIWPHTPIGKRLLTPDETLTDVLPRGEYYQRSDLTGKVGVAKSMMLPSGQVVIDGQKYDAVSDGFAIEAGDKVKVVSVKENRIYVQPYDDDDTDSTPDQTVAEAGEEADLNSPMKKFDLDSDSIDGLLGN